MDINKNKFPLLYDSATNNQESTPNNYSVYRCLDPLKFKTDQPWYRISNVCPCNPEESNITGRGYTPCNFGIQEDQSEINSLSSGPRSTTSLPLVGSLYQNKQYTPPQLDPRMLSRIGNKWLNAY